MTGVTNKNWNCSPCAINVDAGGLQRIVWFTETISLNLDTVSVFVTTYNGSNSTAITSYSTIYGDIEAVNASQVPAATSIYQYYIFNAVMQYGGGGSIYLARATDGRINSAASYAWPTPYMEISAVAYTTTIPFSDCPSGLQPVTTNILTDYFCGCALDGTNHGINPLETNSGLATTKINLPSNLYFPISPKDFNMTLLESNMLDEFAYLNFSDLTSSLAKQPWATSLIPNMQQCIQGGMPQGPPGVKIPVSALTTTITTTTHGINSLPPASLQTSSSSALPGPSPNPISTPTPTTSPSPSTSNSPNPQQSSESPGTSPSKESSAVIAGGSSSVSKAAGESAVAVGNPASSPTTSLAIQNSPTLNSLNNGVPSAPINSLTQPSPSSVIASALPVTQAVVASQTIPLPSSAVSQLVVAGTTLAAAGPAATMGDQVVSLQSSALIVGTSTHLFVPSGEPTAVTTIGNYIVHSVPDKSALVVAGSTLNPGASAVTIAGTAISLGSSNLVIGSSTIALSYPPQEESYANSAQQAGSYPTEVVTLGHTITQGAPAITVSGTPISLGSSGLAIGSTMISLPFVTPYPSEYVTLGHTITQGAPAITVSGTPISLGSSGLAIGSTTISLSPAASPAIFTAAGQVITPLSNGGVIVAGKTIAPGAPAVTVSGTPISLGSSGLAIGSTTISLPSTTSQAVFTVAGQAITPLPNGVIIAGQTLLPGAPAITASGAVISLSPSNLVIGTSTIALLTTYSPQPTGFTLGGQTFTISRAAVAIYGTTLTPGAPATTIDGTLISLGASQLVIGSSTYALPTTASLLTLANGDVFTVNPVEGVQISGSTLLEGGSALTVGGTRISLGTGGVVVGDSTVVAQTTQQGVGGAIMAGFGPSSSTAGAVAANGTVTGQLATFSGRAATFKRWDGLVAGVAGVAGVVGVLIVWV